MWQQQGVWEYHIDYRGQYDGWVRRVGTVIAHNIYSGANMTYY